MEIPIHFPLRSLHVWKYRRKNTKQVKRHVNAKLQYVLETNYKANDVIWTDCSPFLWHEFQALQLSLGSNYNLPNYLHLM